MNTTTPAAGAEMPETRRRLRPLSAVLVALATVLAFVGLGTSNASAAVYDYSVGSPGHVWTAPVVGRGHITSSGSVVPGLRLPSLTVSRSGATTGQQTVVAEHRIHEYVGGQWRLRSTLRSTVVIPAGLASNSTLNHVLSLPQFNDSLNGYGTGYWTVWTNVTWHDAFGRGLGGRTVNFNTSGDYACEASRFVLCQVGPGWVRVA
jgi:hypothetical protein